MSPLESLMSQGRELSLFETFGECDAFTQILQGWSTDTF